MDLECDVCTERFDYDQRLPKALPCGHTACLQCLRRLPDRRCPHGVKRSCPTCRQDFNGPPEGLPSNFLALKLMEGVRQDSTPRCLEDHDVLPVKRDMGLHSISYSRPNDQRRQKAALLRDAPGVTRLVQVNCHADPAWSLQLLQRATPTLERLHVNCPREAHLRAVDAMPRLRRLYVWGDHALDAQPPELAALPPGHAGLQWLRVHNLPRATTQSLLRAHGGTLEELELVVGTAGSGEWPYSCRDLHSLLQQSGLRALRRLVLLRRGWCRHEPAACSEQRAEVQRVLPRAEVLCGTCHRVREEEV